MDKSQYQQIQALIAQNPVISGFDLYYLGFFSHFVPQLTLNDIFTHIGNIISLHNDQLITNEEKIEFLIRMLSKKIDSSLIKSLAPQTVASEKETTNFLHEYFSKILQVISKYNNISKFELFYLGHFHAICPSYRIAELFHHINNINVLVKEDLIDEETQVDFLLKILNKKIKASNTTETVLNIPQENMSPFKQQENTSEQNLNLNIENSRAFLSLTPQPSPFNQTEKARTIESYDPEASRDYSQKSGDLGIETYSPNGMSPDNDTKEDKKGNSWFNQETEEKSKNLNVEKIKKVQKAVNNKEKEANEKIPEFGSVHTIEEKKAKPTQQSQEKQPQAPVMSKQFTFQASFGSFTSEEDQGSLVREEFGSDKKNKEKGLKDNKAQQEEKELREAKDLKSQEKGLEKDKVVEDSVDYQKPKEKKPSQEKEMNLEEDKMEEEKVVEMREDRMERIESGDKEIEEKDRMELDQEEDKVAEKETEQDKDLEQTKPPNNILESKGSMDQFNEDNKKSDMVIETEERQRNNGVIGDHHEGKKKDDLTVVSQNVRQIEKKDSWDVEEKNMGVQDKTGETDLNTLLEKEKPKRSYTSSSGSQHEALQQLYPEKKRPQIKGTLEDILDQLLESEDTGTNISQKPSQPESRGNNILPSLGQKVSASLNEGITSSPDVYVNPTFTAGQMEDDSFPVPKRHASKQTGSSLDVKNDIMNKLEYKESANQSQREDIDEPSANIYKVNILKPSVSEEESSQQDSSLILKWKMGEQNTEKPQANKDFLLQQIINYSKISLEQNPIPKREESEARGLLEANTQADATQDDGLDYESDRSPMPKSPNYHYLQIGMAYDQAEPSVKGCSTVKQTPSEITRDNPFEDLQSPEDMQEEGPLRQNSLGENVQESQEPVRRDSLGDDIQESQSSRPDFKNLYSTQLSSGMPEILNTLEEADLSLKLLADLEKERKQTELIKEREKKNRQEETVSRSQNMIDSQPRMEKEYNNSSMEEEKIEAEPNAEGNMVQDKEKERNIDAENERNTKKREGLSQENVEKNASQNSQIKQSMNFEENKIFEDSRGFKEITLGQRDNLNNEGQSLLDTNQKKIDVDSKKQSSQESMLVEREDQCDICLKDRKKGLTVEIGNCNHEFHQECLIKHVNENIDNQVFPLKCPKGSCLNNLLLTDIVDLLDPERQEKYVKTSLKAYIENNSNVVCCPSPGCSFAFFKTYRPNRFRCPVCKKVYCMSCRVDWHQTTSCSEHQKSQKREESQSTTGNKCKQCPKCKYWIEKRADSNIMECNCGTSLCYYCGKTILQGEDHSNHKDLGQRPMVQPELFHKAMEAPQEFKEFAEKKTSTRNKSPGKSVSGIHSGTVGHIYRPATQDSKEGS